MRLMPRPFRTIILFRFTFRSHHYLTYNERTGLHTQPFKTEDTFFLLQPFNADQAGIDFIASENDMITIQHYNTKKWLSKGLSSIEA